MRNKLLIFGLICMLAGGLLSIVINLAKAQVSTAPTVASYNGNDSLSIFNQANRYATTLAAVMHDCSLEAPFSNTMSDCVAMAHDYTAHLKQLFSSHSSLLNQMLGVPMN